MSIINKNDKYLDYQDHMAENLAIGVVILVLVDEVVADLEDLEDFPSKF